VQKSFRKADLQNLLLIIIIPSLLYFHAYKSPFHLDDFITIIDRPLIKNLSIFFDEDNNPYAASGIFQNRVFLLYSFALNYHIGNLNVIGYHLVNVIIHLIVSILIYFLVKEILACQPLNTSQSGKKQFQYSRTIPLLASLLFSVHPLQTESVTYISSRSTLAVTFFFLGSLLFFIKGSAFFFNPLKEIKHKIYIVNYFLFGILFFLLGLGFKETIVVLPLIFFLYILLFYSRQIRLSRKVLGSIFLLIFLLLIHGAGFFMHSKEIDRLAALYKTSEFQEKSIQDAMVKLKEIKKKQHPFLNLFYFSTDEPNILTNIYRSIYSRGKYVYSVGKVSYSEKVYFLSELEIIVFYYLKLLFLPFNQSVFPDFPEFNIEHWKTLIGALFVIVLLSTYCLFSNLRLISFSFFWYIVTIMPYTTFIPLTDLVSEHRTYLPNIGFFIAVSTGLAALLTLKKRLISLSFILAILVSASMLTLKRNFIWQSEISLWEDSVKKAPGHVKSINALGAAYIRAGKHEKAQPVFQKGLKIDPFNHTLNINMGIIFKKNGNLDKAEEHFKLAALISKDYLAFINLGSIYLERDLYFQGIEEFNKALSSKPDSHLAYFYLGIAYNDLKDYKKAIQYFEKSIELNSDFSKAYNNLGFSYWNLGKHDEAYEWFVKAMNKQPELPTPYLNIGNYFLIKGQQKQAEDFLKRYQEKLKNEKK
tara:strand:+ start:209 stop:2314 length:2106 start_codon:yes stop_codon:yes gene_type:complete